QLSDEARSDGQNSEKELDSDSTDSSCIMEIENDITNMIARSQSPDPEQDEAFRLLKLELDGKNKMIEELKQGIQVASANHVAESSEKDSLIESLNIRPDTSQKTKGLYIEEIEAAMKDKDYQIEVLAK
ncbi:6875_t:CDS:2, partial [Racocetra persica]